MGINREDILKGSVATLETAGGIVTPVPASAADSWTPVTTLPTAGTAPVVLVDSLSAPTYSWLLVYSAAAGGWLFIGGPPIVFSGASTTLPAHAGTYVITAKTWMGNGGTTSGGNLTTLLQVAGSTVDTASDYALPAALYGGGARSNSGAMALVARVTAAASAAVAISNGDQNQVITILPVKLTS